MNWNEPKFDELAKQDFLRAEIVADLRAGRYDGVHTRFPPEPNGYIHIGNAKAIWLNYCIARDFGGKFNLRFDDTNPIKEEKEYIDSIIRDVAWLGADFEDRVFYASDYFQQMYDFAIDLIKKGKAYVCELTADQISEYRGDYNTPGKPSPWRDRPIEESLDIFGRMKNGEFPDGSRTLRAKIDMASSNMNMRDPIMYRILHASHPHAGDKWCIYPMYDWAHGLEDSIERITHSMCSIEFENHRPLYDWFLIELGTYRPRQIEFARMNLSYTIMSKRYLKLLVDRGHVTGWDDPRMPTVSGMRRRGYPAAAIQDFLSRAGIAKKSNTIALEVLEHCVREDLNRNAPRFMGVLNPLKVVIDNLPDDHVDFLDAVNNPENPEAGTRKVPFTRELFIERDDFMEVPEKKFFRLAPGREVRLRYAYFLTCNSVIKDSQGNITELRCTVDPATRGGNSPDGRKVKSTMHWVSASKSVSAEVRNYDKLFTVEDPMGQEKEFTQFLNPESLTVLSDCKVEPATADLKIGDRVQLERLGYFCVDLDSAPGKPVFNRTVSLKDSYSKIQAKK
ncbi:MAG: glutamine--tRNA ligase/YqeY domain fusion protein [Candidatus Thermoplasmatota archaeon]|nr:glutamine--tRNA ligase/YqeY domain fusion protein [Euryarchaeota archaeon]MBU4071310.1 glutamine--tRNA ligase/YqeY domain fusion protein [Candidatus Thermoplasmatota archaeon]MBU4143395.1 glutamine--tRNA ligase/YqeY domain fusion protein [Candidatus Thermoplasmatota archaeon]MBU4592214.1 glutamine--tRNA ligase/YqeY domain fusion protein [Candidatus Thermoplasmatota archaeon]